VMIDMLKYCLLFTQTRELLFYLAGTGELVMKHNGTPRELSLQINFLVEMLDDLEITNRGISSRKFYGILPHRALGWDAKIDYPRSGSGGSCKARERPG
jgi:hypothetical protein